MGSLSENLSYLWMRLPLILTFSSGYILYLVLSNTKLIDFFVLWNLKRSRGSLSSLLVYILGISALLSFFIPNAVTVLCLLPFLKFVSKNLDGDGSAITVLTLSAIYGANLGGMGSIIGSPANLLLVAFLDINRVPGSERVSFLSWFLWSIPLVILLCTLAWILLIRFGLSRRLRRSFVPLESANEHARLTREQGYAGALFVFFVCFWIADGMLDYVWGAFGTVETYACIAFFLLFVYLTFLKSCGHRRMPLLRFRDLLRHLPKRGFVFLGAVVLLIPLLQWSGLFEKAVPFATGLIPGGDHGILVLIAVTFIVIFLTEIFSNTVVATAFFTIGILLAPAHGVDTLTLMICISTASTCAFMTPIATPCNALAFGEMKGTSLPRMLALGLPMNILSAIAISFWLRFIIPLVYA